MRKSTSKTTTLILFLSIALAATAVVEAHEFQAHRRDHGHLKRMIRKRAPQDEVEDDSPFPTLIGVPRPPAESESLSASLSASSSSSSASSASASSASNSASASLSASASASSLSSASASESTEEPSSSSESVEPSSSTEPEEQPTSTPPPEPSATLSEPEGVSTIVRGGNTRTVQVDVQATAPPSMARAAQSEKNKSNVMTILIAVAASLGGVFILWTVFRKWKLGSSRKFDKRLRPVESNWVDDKATHGDDIIPANRRHSGSSQSSGRSRANQHGALPDHDFTAVGPTHSSPVGGYADLSRGPSQYSGGYNGARY